MLPSGTLLDPPEFCFGSCRFAPTITTLTGSFRSLRAWIPKNQSMQLKANSSAQVGSDDSFFSPAFSELIWNQADGS
jgi:hypothetical protein